MNAFVFLRGGRGGTVMAHQSFRPSDFAWRDLPLILVSLTAAPLISFFRAAGLWPTSRRADGVTDARVRPWRKTLWRSVLVLWLVLPVSSLIVSGVATYGLGRGWISHSTAMTLSRPAYLIIERTPFDTRYGILWLSILNKGLKDGGLQMSDLR